jgi:hypothetical protein
MMNWKGKGKCLERLRKTTKTFYIATELRFKPSPSKCKAEMLTTELQCLVECRLPSVEVRESLFQELQCGSYLIYNEISSLDVDVGLLSCDNMWTCNFLRH